MIEKILRKTPFYLEYKDDEDNEFICYFDSFKQLMYHAAKEIAFADCSGVHDEVITANGRKIEYMGWEPNIRMRFRDVKTKKVVWDEYYDEWDH